jgi:hypothetical protein
MRADHLHRAEDRDTSVAAAEFILTRVSRMQVEVLGFAFDRGARGFSDILLSTHFNSTSSAYRSRRSELTQLGQIVDSGRRVKLRTGRSAIVWIHHKFAQKAEGQHD